MSGPLDNIRVVLTAPLYGGNVGSVCRAMANMGVSDLVLAAPQALDTQETLRMACSAAAIYHNRRETATLDEAVADCVMVAGASAREGLYRSHALSPRELAPRLLQTAAHNPVALVFGRETSGLSNTELALCTQIIRIPSTPAYASLNLAQAVMVCLYEVYVAADSFEAPVEPSPPAPSELRERMLSLWEAALMHIGFMEREKAEHMMLGLRRIFSRGQLTVNDVRILMGVARQMHWNARRGAAPSRNNSPRNSEAENQATGGNR